MANAYHLICARDFEVVTPASPAVIRRADGTKEVVGDLPESRYSKRAGERYVARRKAEAESMVRTGNWTWE